MATKRDLESGFKRIGQLPYGARYYRVDLHFHTPASSDARGSNRYNLNPCRSECSLAETKVMPDQTDVFKDQADKRKQAVALASKMVERFREEKISVVAVTDHNSIGTIWPDYGAKSKCMHLAAPTWYEVLDDEAHKRNTKEGKEVLTILPGVEIGTAGIHILAVFPPQEPRRKAHFLICDLLCEMGFAIDDFGQVSVVGDLSVESAIDLIVRKGGVPILAHIDGTDKAWLQRLKLFKLGSATMTNVLKSSNLSAAEIVNPATLKKKRRKEKVVIKTWVDEVRKDVGLDPIAYFQGSDAHDLKTIGKRYSFAKMTGPSFSGLKMAIQMPSSRLRVSEVAAERLEGLFLYGMKIDSDHLGKHFVRFNRHMNCVVGKRDAGKSLLFHMMQSAVDPNQPASAGSINLYVEKATMNDGKAPRCRHYVFARDAKGDSVALHPISARGKVGRELKPVEAEELGIKPHFYREAEVEELITSKQKMNEFVVRLFGKPIQKNIRTFNKLFDIPEFCAGKSDRLISAEKGQDGYTLYGNINWRRGKEKKVEFFRLTKSMRRTLVVCMLMASSSAGPLIMDAPEGNFDNEDMVNYLIPMIKTFKDYRQIVLFTASALLAVNTDPDNYIVLNTKAKKSDRLKSGFSIDEIEEKDLLINLMEGSRKSFKRRADCYSC